MGSGRAYRELGYHKKAIEAFTLAISLLPELIDAYKKTFEMLSSDFELEYYEGIMEALGEMQVNRAYCYLHLGDSDKAVKDFDAAIKLMSGNVDFYCARASAYVQIDEHAKAMKDLETAAQLDGSSANVPFVRAVSHFNRGQLHSAIEDSTQAIELSPNRGDFYCVRGRSHLHLGDYASAMSDLSRSIELGPEDGAVFQLHGPDAYVCRGLAHTLLGNDTAAKQDYRRAVESGYSEVSIEEELAELTQAGKAPKSVIAFVQDVTFAGRLDVTGQSQTSGAAGPTAASLKSADRPSPRPPVGKPSTMNKDEYTTLFQELGFYDIEVGKTLKHRRPLPSLYFNCRYGSVSFVGYVKDQHRYGSGLWDRIPPQKNKDDLPKLITIVPKLGREREAFEELLLIENA